MPPNIDAISSGEPPISQEKTSFDIKTTYRIARGVMAAVGLALAACNPTLEVF